MYTVTSVTHREGDMRTFRSFVQAYSYAVEIVECGLSPEMETPAGETLDWSGIFSEAMERGYI